MTPGIGPRAGAVPNVELAIAAELRDAVNEALVWLRDVSAERSQARPRPGAWSAREIVGHLIDSASNNHGRFVRGALQESLVFPPYDQEAWVALHQYQHQDWHGLLDRWSSFNEQIVAAIEHIPSDALQRPRRDHNFDRIAWRIVPVGAETTLEYFLRDYIGHLRHHVEQISRAVRD